MIDVPTKLRDGLVSLGFGDPILAETLLKFATMVLEANERTNLVGSKSLDELIAAHILDSLAPFSGRPLEGSLIDVGSGAGFPGIPISAAFPTTHVRMIEPRAKRAEFLADAIEKLGLVNCSARKSTAETAGRSDLRESARTVTLRAVAKPATALELSLPLVKVSGRALLYVGRQAIPSDHEMAVADLLGGRLQEANEVAVPYLQGVRHAWWFEKKKATPTEFPRRAKVPSKQPL